MKVWVVIRHEWEDHDVDAVFSRAALATRYVERVGPDSAGSRVHYTVEEWTVDQEAE